MMKQFVLLAGLLLISAVLQAQRYDEICTAQVYAEDEFNDLPWVGNNAWLGDYLDSIGYTGNSFNYDNAIYRVPVFLWIYQGKKGGNMHLGAKRIKKYITNLNYFYSKNNTGILFYLQGYQEIRNSKHREMGYYLEGPAQSIKNKADGAINVYIVDRMKKTESKYVKGTYNGVTNAIFIQKNASQSTLAHEIGHYFGLLHPHEQWDKGKCRAEAVSRTRKFKGCLKSGLICEENGDGLCDTPAEPNLQKYSDANCSFFANHLRDPWGDKYQPNTNNIMSYTKKRNCRDHFTEGQIAVMLQTASKDSHSHAWRVNRSKAKYRIDSSEPDDTPKMATALKLNAPHYFTFHCIYLGSNGEKTDQTDWISFKLGKKRKVKILTKKGEHKQPALSLKLYKKEKLLKSAKKPNFPSISTTLQKGKYFLEISNRQPDRQLTDYQIEIKTM